jgi:hypothetical protein
MQSTLAVLRPRVGGRLIEHNMSTPRESQLLSGRQQVGLPRSRLRRVPTPWRAAWIIPRGASANRLACRPGAQNHIAMSRLCVSRSMIAGTRFADHGDVPACSARPHADRPTRSTSTARSPIRSSDRLPVFLTVICVWRNLSNRLYAPFDRSAAQIAAFA